MIEKWTNISVINDVCARVIVKRKTTVCSDRLGNRILPRTSDETINKVCTDKRDKANDKNAVSLQQADRCANNGGGGMYDRIKKSGDAQASNNLWILMTRGGLE